MSRPPTLSADKQAELREKFTGANYAALGAEYGVSSSTVRRILKTEIMAVKGGSYTEFGVTGLTRFGGNVQEDYLREWGTLDRLVPTVRKMLDHPTVAAVMFALEMTVRGADWIVTPASEDDADKQAAEFLESCLDDMSHTWDDFIAQAITMVSYGFAPFEIVYKRRLGPDKDPASIADDGLIGWRKFAYRAPDTLAVGDEWVFDEAGGIQGLNQATQPTWQKIFIPIEKTLLFRTTAAKNNPQGRSILRGAFIPWYGAKTFAELEGIAAERMGAGIPIMYLGKGSSLVGATSDYELAKDLVRNVRIDEQFGIVVPRQKMGPDGEGMLFELLSPPSRGIVDFHQVIERYKQEISQTLLAQFLFFGLTAQGTQALAVRSTDFFTQAVGGWLKMMAQTINMHAVARLFKMNPKFAALEVLPTIDAGSVDVVDVAALMGAITQATSAGALTAGPDIERAVRQALNLPDMPQELDEMWQKKAEARLKLIENPVSGINSNTGKPSPFAPKEDKAKAQVLTESLKVMREAIMHMGADAKPADKQLADVAREVRIGRAQANTVFANRTAKIEKAAAEQAMARQDREDEVRVLAALIAKMGDTLTKIAAREPVVHVAAPNITVEQAATEVIDVKRDRHGLIERIFKRRGG